jgi:hypothetical protein
MPQGFIFHWFPPKAKLASPDSATYANPTSVPYRGTVFKYSGSSFKDTQTCPNEHQLSDLCDCEINIPNVIQLTDVYGGLQFPQCGAAKKEFAVSVATTILADGHVNPIKNLFDASIASPLQVLNGPFLTLHPEPSTATPSAVHGFTVRSTCVEFDSEPDVPVMMTV